MYIHNQPIIILFRTTQHDMTQQIDVRTSPCCKELDNHTHPQFTSYIYI